MYWKQLSLLLLLSLAGSAAKADSIYNVQLNTGSASVSGTITTDGTTGVLTTGNILGFDLTFASGSYSNTIVNKSVQIMGGNFSATSTGLDYDFTNATTSNFAAFSSDLTGTQDFLCITGGDNCAYSFMTAAVLQVNGVDSAIDFSGVQQIASLATSPTSPTSPVAATPEPSSLVLLGTGLLGVAGTLRRRFVA